MIDFRQIKGGSSLHGVVNQLESVINVTESLSVLYDDQTRFRLSYTPSINHPITLFVNGASYTITKLASPVDAFALDISKQNEIIWINGTDSYSLLKTDVISVSYSTTMPRKENIVDRHLLYGKIVDSSTGLPIEGVKISMVESIIDGGNTFKLQDGYSVFTDIDGNFRIEGLPIPLDNKNNRYSITGTKEGYSNLILSSSVATIDKNFGTRQMFPTSNASLHFSKGLIYNDDGAITSQTLVEILDFNSLSVITSVTITTPLDSYISPSSAFTAGTYKIRITTEGNAVYITDFVFKTGVNYLPFTKLTKLVTPEEPVNSLQYDFTLGIMEDSKEVLTQIAAMGKTLSNTDVYGANMDGLNNSTNLYFLGYDGQPENPVLVPRQGVDSATATNPDGKWRYDEATGIINFESGSLSVKKYRVIRA